jgi:hypothetical protein
MTFKVEVQNSGKVFIQSSGRIFRGSLKAANRRNAGFILKGIQDSTEAILNKNPTGRLRDSFRVKDVNQKGAMIISNLPYAAIHERGGRAGRGGAVLIRPTRYITKGVLRAQKPIETFNKKFLVVVSRKAKRKSGG